MKRIEYDSARARDEIRRHVEESWDDRIPGDDVAAHVVKTEIADAMQRVAESRKKPRTDDASAA